MKLTHPSLVTALFLRILIILFPFRIAAQAAQVSTNAAFAKITVGSIVSTATGANRQLQFGVKYNF